MVAYSLNNFLFYRCEGSEELRPFRGVSHDYAPFMIIQRSLLTDYFCINQIDFTDIVHQRGIFYVIDLPRRQVHILCHNSGKLRHPH